MRAGGGDAYEWGVREHLTKVMNQAETCVDTDTNANTKPRTVCNM